MLSLLLDILLIILVVAILTHLYQNNALFMECDESTHHNRETFNSVYENIDQFMTNISENKLLGKIGVADSADQNRKAISEPHDRLNYSDAVLKKILDSVAQNRVDEHGRRVSQKIEEPYPSVEENAPADLDQPTRIEMTSYDNYKADLPVPSGTENTKRYLRNYVLNGRKYCDGSSYDENRNTFARKDIDSYREKQLEFRDMVYGTSMNADDAVDQMALIALEGGFDPNGQTISNVYDRMTSVGAV